MLEYARMTGQGIARRGRVAAAVALASLLLHTAPARAACNDLVITGGAVQISVSPDFNPLTGSDLVSAPVSITISNGGPGNCPSASLLIRQAPATANPTKYMAKGAEQLAYVLEAVGPLDFSVASGGTATVQVRARIRAVDNPFRSAGLYEDVNFNSVFVYQGTTPSTNAVVTSAPFSASVSVTSVCDLPPPNVTALNFSSAISDGMPNGTVLSSSFSNVRCTNPANVTLTADAMRPAPAVPASSGFDNFINFTATAVFGSASVSLTTDADLADDTVTSSTDSGAPISSGAISVDVHLVPGNVLAAGTYASTLTVSVDPKP